MDFLKDLNEAYRDTYKKAMKPITDKNVYVINDIEWTENKKEICASTTTDNSAACPFFDKFLPKEPMSVKVFDELVQNRYAMNFQKAIGTDDFYNGSNGQSITVEYIGAIPISFIYTEFDTICQWTDQQSVIKKIRTVRAKDSISLVNDSRGMPNWLATDLYFNDIGTYLSSTDY